MSSDRKIPPNNQTSHRHPHDNPQMPITKQGRPLEEERSARESDDFGLLISQIPSWAVLKGEPNFAIGVVVHSAQVVDPLIFATTKPVSSCTLQSLAVLHDNKKNSMDRDEAARFWIENNRLTRDEEASKSLKVGWGEEGFRELLQDSDIDAIYIIVPPGSQRDYVLASLEAGKHVLLNDPVSTALSEFKEQLAVAKEHGKFVQFSTMFVHQYRVRRVIDRALRFESLGRTNKIKAMVRLNYADVEKVGVKLPLGPTSGCIRVLGRYCVLFSALFFSRCGSFARSAKAEKVVSGNHGEVVSAMCTVKFTEGRELTFDVAFTHSTTRQSIELEADNRTVEMKDFIIEHPDGLATYRVYDKAAVLPGHSEVQVVRGESIDVLGGPPQDTMM